MTATAAPRKSVQRQTERIATGEQDMPDNVAIPNYVGMEEGAEYTTEFVDMDSPVVTVEHTEEELLERRQKAGLYVKSVLESRVDERRFYVNKNREDYITQRSKVAHMMGSGYRIEDTDLLPDGIGFQRDSYATQKLLFMAKGEIIEVPEGALL